jgi:hypothetical protein
MAEFLQCPSHPVKHGQMILSDLDPGVFSQAGEPAGQWLLRSESIGDSAENRNAAPDQAHRVRPAFIGTE